MKVLLDENLPHALRQLFTGHDVFTVAYMQWNGIRNGELLTKAASDGFEAVITNDAGMAFEQNRHTLPVAVLQLNARSLKVEDLEPLVPRILRALSALKPRTFTVLDG